MPGMLGLGFPLVETANHRGGAAFINPGRLRAGYYCGFGLALTGQSTSLCINKNRHALTGLSKTELNLVRRCGNRSESELGPAKPIRIRSESEPGPAKPIRIRTNQPQQNRSESELSPAKPSRIRTLEGRNRSESELTKSNPNPGIDAISDKQELTQASNAAWPPACCAVFARCAVLVDCQPPREPPRELPPALPGKLPRTCGTPPLGIARFPCIRHPQGHPHSATAGYPARSSQLLDGKSARMGMASCRITVTSPSDTVGHIASYVILNATMWRLRNHSQNGAECCQPRWRLNNTIFLPIVG